MINWDVVYQWLPFVVFVGYYLWPVYLDQMHKSKAALAWTIIFYLMACLPTAMWTVSFN